MVDLAQPSTKGMIEFVRRISAFSAFQHSVLSTRDLADAIAVSRPTAHRIIASFEENDLVARVEGGYQLTGFGMIIGDAAGSFQEEISKAYLLKPLLLNVPPEVDLDIDIFADARVTNARHDNPLGPLKRFVEQFEGAKQIKAFNRSYLEPMYIHLAQEQISNGMEVDIIYESRVIELIIEEFPEFVNGSLSADNVTATVRNDLPFGMALFENEIGLGIYTELIGTPIAWIDTDNPDAVAWGEQLFKQHKADATLLT